MDIMTTKLRICIVLTATQTIKNNIRQFQKDLKKILLGLVGISSTIFV